MRLASLIKKPRGRWHGASVFHRSRGGTGEAPWRFSRALKAHPNLPLRMGVHSGPVSAVFDVNNQTASPGPAITWLNEVMDCGDAGHILLSKNMSPRFWSSIRIGNRICTAALCECEVKHGMRVGVVMCMR